MSDPESDIAEQVQEMIELANRNLAIKERGEKSSSVCEDGLETPEETLRKDREEVYEVPIMSRHCSVPSEYQHNKSINTQIAAIGRQIVMVPSNGNSMFMSISLQIEDPIINHRYLRQLMVTTGIRNAHKFSRLISKREEEFSRVLEEMARDKAWDEELADLMIYILQHAIQRKIVVIRSNSTAQHFPNDGTPINEDTIVIVTDDCRTHYDGTSLLYHRLTSPNSPGTVCEQLRVMKKILDPVPDSGNSFYECIARQIACGDSSEGGAMRLRRMVFSKIWSSQARRKVSAELPNLGKNDYWTIDSADLMMNTLAYSLEVNIIVVRNCKTPLRFPNNAAQAACNKNTCVIVQDDYYLHHFHSTIDKPAEFSGHGTAADQLSKIGRVIDCVPDDGNSFFESVARQLEDPHLDHAKLRRMVFDKMREDGVMPGDVVKQMYKSNFWELRLADSIIMCLADALGTKIIVLQDHQPPHHYPFDGYTLEQIDLNTYIVVQHSAYPHHYDAAIHHPRESDEILLPKDPSKLDKFLSKLKHAKVPRRLSFRSSSSTKPTDSDRFTVQVERPPSLPRRQPSNISDSRPRPRPTARRHTTVPDQLCPTCREETCLCVPPPLPPRNRPLPPPSYGQRCYSYHEPGSRDHSPI